MCFGHKFKRSGKFIVPVDDPGFEAVAFNERLDGHIRANLRGGFICDSEQVEEDVFEVYDGNHHARIDIFNQYSMYFLHDHREHDIGQFCFFYDGFEPNVAFSAVGFVV